MITPAELFPRVEEPKSHVRLAVHKRAAGLTVPPGGLGRLHDIAAWIAACQGTCPPQPLETPTIVVFAGSHEVVNRTLTPVAEAKAFDRLAQIDEGAGPVGVMSRCADARITTVNVSAQAPSTTDATSGNTAPFSPADSIDVADAMSEADCEKALSLGIEAADKEVDSGADILVAGWTGTGADVAAYSIIGVITRFEPVKVVGWEAGWNELKTTTNKPPETTTAVKATHPSGNAADEVWKRTTAAVRDAMFRARALRHDPLRLLTTIGGPDIAALAGFLAQAAVRHTPVIIDGPVTAAAALVANQLAPGARAWWMAGSSHPAPCHAHALDELGLGTPILDMRLRTDDGSGASMALPIVRCAVNCLSEIEPLTAVPVTHPADER